MNPIPDTEILIQVALHDFPYGGKIHFLFSEEIVAERILKQPVVIRLIHRIVADGLIQSYALYPIIQRIAYLPHYAPLIAVDFAFKRISEQVIRRQVNKKHV